MFRQLPMYQQVGGSAYRTDLTNIEKLCDHLGHPEMETRFIHVAGTNGKGSTSHMLASVLQEAEYKTGLFTSPHLKDFRERIRIDGCEIPKEYVVEFIEEHRKFFEGNNLSFFEMCTGLAFDFFRSAKVDIAVIETGMGGRLDSTNVIVPLLSVITNIGLDHTAYLGNSLEQIATEKAGIIKNGIPVVVGEYTSETKPVFENKAATSGSDIYFASNLVWEIYESDLKGEYQRHNIKTVVQSVRILNARDNLAISDEALRSGLLNVVPNTGLQGRWQKLRDKPLVIADTAHNRNGLEAVMKQIEKLPCTERHFVIGMVNDKNLDDVLPLFPKDGRYYFCRPAVSRGLDEKLLQESAMQHRLIGQRYGTVNEAYAAALSAASNNDLVYIGGSTFVVAEIL